MTIEQTFASVLVAAAERAYLLASAKHPVGVARCLPNTRTLIRHAKAVALHYDLMPERNDDDDGIDDE